MSTGSERRKHDRAPVYWSVTVETPHGLTKGEARNVSTSGAYVECALPCEPGEEVILRILPSDRGPLKIIAEVIWSMPHPPYGMGLAFAKIEEKDLHYIREAIKRANAGRSLR